MNITKQREEFFEQSARIFKLLGSPIKLKILNYISFCPRTVEDCAKKMDQSVQNISLHLISLTKAGILEVEQVKNFRFYSVSSNPIVQVIYTSLNANPASLLPSEFQWATSSKELVDGIRKNKITLIDLRNFDETQYITVKNTLSYDGSLSKINKFLEKFSQDQQLIFFCKGRMCERLAQAVVEAKEAGYNIKGLPLSAEELKELSTMLN